MSNKERDPVEGTGPLTNTATAPSCRSANAAINARSKVAGNLDSAQALALYDVRGTEHGIDNLIIGHDAGARLSAAREEGRSMPTVAVSLNGLPLFKYQETSPTSTAELFAVVEAAADEAATTVERLISSAMTNLLQRQFLHDGDGDLEKNCLTYLVLSEPVPSSKAEDPAATIAEWLPALDFRVNIISESGGFVLEISKDEIKSH